MRVQKVAAVAAVLLASSTFAFTGQKPTKDDAVAMVKQAVAAIKAAGPEKGYAEVDAGKFRNGSLYVIV